MARPLEFRNAAQMEIEKMTPGAVPAVTPPIARQ
jgi:hypothetical protein